ncbi:MAG: hypothetical protein NTV23_03595 [Propionibacteriales bacterium]|nr:hypothetical protein [Propionibacteriales bacterium]
MSISARALQRRIGRAAVLLLVAAGVTLVAPGGNSATAAGGAISTTTNVGAGTGQCLSPDSADDPINCNSYAAKPDVWLSNLPQALPDGDYFFAVVSPGGQADPNDGTPKLLSTDSHLDRTFKVVAGTVTTAGTTGNHAVVNNQVQLADFADTTNGGGVYVAVVCAAADYPVAGGDCKYDAFKVGPSAATPQGLEILKDAAGSYVRTYDWDITKVADKTYVKQVGGTTTINYTVEPTHDAGTVSLVTVTGTISVFNPNNEAVEGVTVSDVLSDGTVCTVTGGTDATILVGDNTFPYTCSPASLPAAQLDNTATATWTTQAVDGGTLNGSASSFTFSSVTFTSSSTDECVTVTDTFAGTLGTRCVGDAADGTSYTYPRTITVVPNCSLYDNTATFTTNDSAATDSASASVTVCGPLATGAKTIGFWQNKNGQGIISGGANTPMTTTCASTTYLRSLAPFQDLTAGSKCADVAKYVAKVLGAATAAGPTMNAMLKAQMLATALDVFFTGQGSTTATQKFLPNSNLGAVVVDLTMICTNIPVCSSLQNVSSSFLGSSRTVAQMLADAAANSNAGGSVWYGQNKIAQEKAKNAFDAVNNEVIFAP